MLASECFLKHHVLPTFLHSQCLNRWDLREYEELMEKYYLLYWSTDHFQEMLVNGEIHHQAEKYLVVYHQTETPTRMIAQSKQIALSFRKPIPDFGIPGYVLVKGCR